MRFIRTREVLGMIGVGRTTLWKMVQAGSFPRPVRITERSSGYLLDSVEQWMRLRARGLPPRGTPQNRPPGDGSKPATTSVVDRDGGWSIAVR